MEMRLKIVVFIILSFSLSTLKAQNLILNGDFEEYYDCPEEQGDFELCKNWYVPNYSTPDYFRACPGGSSAFGIPYNFNGKQESRSGKAYIGLGLIWGHNYKYREYVEGELKGPLQKGKEYLVVLYVNWADFSAIHCNKIGYLFTSGKQVPIGKVNYQNDILPRSSGCVKLDLEQLKDKEEWHKIEFIYIAKGGERYLTLGVFKDNLDKNEFEHLINVKYPNPYREKDYAYYYIDDISVVPVDGKREYSHEH